MHTFCILNADVFIDNPLSCTLVAFSRLSADKLSSLLCRPFTEIVHTLSRAYVMHCPVSAHCPVSVPGFCTVASPSVLSHRRCIAASHWRRIASAQHRVAAVACRLHAADSLHEDWRSGATAAGSRRSDDEEGILNSCLKGFVLT